MGFGDSGRRATYFHGIWGEGSFIFRDLGRKHNFLGFREQGLRKNILGRWGERSFFFQGAERKDTPRGGGTQYH